MNFDDIEEFNLTEDVRDIERKFCEIYLKIVMDYLDLDDYFIWTTEEFRKRSKNKGDSMIRNPRELLLNGIQDTCLALRKFYASLMEYIEVIKYLSKTNPMKIFCLIGDSFFAALGICIMINEAVKRYESDKNNIKLIQIIICGKSKDWKNLCFFIVNRIGYFYMNIKIKLEFIDDCPHRLSEGLICKIREADILVMTKFLSTFKTLIKPYFLEVILKSMKDFSILFYLDIMHYDKLKKSISKTKSLIEVKSKKTVYESLEDYGNREYFLQFPLLLTTSFAHVIFSTCIKCPGLKDYNSNTKDTQENSTQLKEFKKQMKLVISEKFGKENSVLSTTSEFQNLSVNSKCSANISVEKNAEESTSKSKKAFILSKKSSKISTKKIFSINEAEVQNVTILSKPSSKISGRKISPVKASELKNLTTSSRCSPKKSFKKIPPINTDEIKNRTIAYAYYSGISVEENRPPKASEAKNLTVPSECSSRMSVGKFLPIKASATKNATIPFECSSVISVEETTPLNASSKTTSKKSVVKIIPGNTSEVNNLIVPSACFSDISTEGKPLILSEVGKLEKSLEKCDDKSNSPSTSKNTSSSNEKKKKLSKQCCKVGKVVRPLPISAVLKKNEYTAEMFKKEKLTAK